MSVITTRYGPSREENGLLDYFGGVFRAIVGRPGKFYRQTQWQRIGDREVLLDCSYGNLIKVAHDVPHLNVVISKGAEMFSNMQVRHLNSKGEEIEKSPILKFLRKPNPLQTFETFAYEYFIHNAVYRVAFEYNNYGSGLFDTPSVLWHLPPGEMKLNLTGKIYEQHEIEGIIENYELLVTGKKYTPREVVMIMDGVASNGITPASRIETLQIPLSNIMAALKSRNIIWGERGAIGIISTEASRDSDGALPLNKGEQDRIQKEYQKDYDLDSRKGHVIVTGANLKWTPTTFDMSQLMLTEGLEDEFATICGSLRIDRDCFPSVKGATFENKKQGEVLTYQSSMLPLANKWLAALAERWGLSTRDERLVASYDHLPVMQEDKQKKAAAMKTAVDAVCAMIEKNMCNPKQGAVIIQAIVPEIRIDPTLATSSKIIEVLESVSPFTGNTMLSAVPVDDILAEFGLPALPNGTGRVPIAQFRAAQQQGNGQNQNQ